MSAYVQTVVGSDSPPIGAVMDFAGNVEPSGWLFCFGQALPRTGIYAQLFQVIGTLYGAPDGSSFNLPDFRGRVGAGRDDMGGTLAGRLTITRSCNVASGNTTIGIASGGSSGLTAGMNVVGLGIPVGAKIAGTITANTFLLSAAPTATNSGTSLRFSIVDGAVLGANGGVHTYAMSFNQMPAHFHALGQMITAGGAAGFPAGSYNIFNSGNTGTAGSDEAHTNVQPTFIVNKIIKYTVSGVVLPIVPGDGDVVGPDGGVADGDVVVFNGTTGKFIRKGSALPSGYILGLGIKNNATDATNDIDIAAGKCSDSTGAIDIGSLSPLTKQLDVAWAAGTGAGGRDTGAIADVWWHVFVIKNTTSGVVDALFSQSATAPTLPSGYTVFRRIGSVFRTAGAIINFLQLGDMFAGPSVSTYSNTAARALALYTLGRCPLGIITFPILHTNITFPSNTAGYFTFAHGLDNSLIISNVAQQNLANAVNTETVTTVSTNLAQQIYLGTTLPVAATLCSASQHGYYDNRGKDGYSP